MLEFQPPDTTMQRLAAGLAPPIYGHPLFCKRRILRYPCLAKRLPALANREPPTTNHLPPRPLFRHRPPPPRVQHPSLLVRADHDASPISPRQCRTAGRENNRPAFARFQSGSQSRDSPGPYSGIVFLSINSPNSLSCSCWMANSLSHWPSLNKSNLSCRSMISSSAFRLTS